MDLLRTSVRLLHEEVTVRALQPAARLVRGVRPQQRAALDAYRDGLRFRFEAEGWSADRRRAWMLARLRTVVRRAHAAVPFYRQRLDDVGFDPAADFSFDDYARIPPLERAEVQRAGSALRIDGSGPVRRDATGGSTGRPTTIWTGPAERGWRESGTEYFMRRIGLPRGRRLALLWGHNLDPVASDRFRDRVRSALEGVRWYDCLRLSPDRIIAYHRDMERWQPAGIVAYATALAEFAAELERHDILPPYPRRALITGAEKLLDEHRAVIERVFGRPVHERYGSRDVGAMGFQLEPATSREFAVDWPNVLIEPDTAQPEASILVTKLHADAMPMLRYRVNDVALFPHASAPGHPAFTLLAISGRAADRVWLHDGRWVHGITFPHLMKDFPVRDFRIHQQADYSVDVTLVRGPGYATEHDDAIRHILRANLDGLPLRFAYASNIERTQANKWRPVMTDVVR